MRKIIACLLLALTLTGCESQTRYGQCKGILDKPEPGLVYRVSVYNTVMSVVFFSAVFPPVLWVLRYAECPVAQEEAPTPKP